MAQSVGAWTSLRRWIYKEGFAVKKGDGTKKGKETHLLLNGGRFVLPDDRNAEFLNMYARAMFEGEWQYIVEKKTPVFYMMCEFDIKMEDREMTRGEIEDIVSIIQRRVMSVAFPGADVRVAVCTAPPKQTTLDNGAPAVQSGIHLLWRVLVDGTTSWQLRAWMLRELEAGLSGFQSDGVTPKFPIKTSWSEAFDSCIFEANGLRMIGSRKAIKCPQCNGESYKTDGEWGTVCTGCQNVGRVDLGRPYNLLYVASPDGSADAEFTEHLKSDPMDLVLFTTIRAINPDGSLPEKACALTFPSPDIKSVVVESARAAKSSKRTAAGKAKTGAAKDPLAVAETKTAAQKKKDKQKELVDLAPDDPKYPAIADYLLGEFNGTPIPTNIKTSGAGDVYIVNTECHYCLNKKGLHNHSSVFFVIRPTGCVQRCFCPKDTRYASGKTCAEFVSSKHQLPSDLKHLIFTDGVLRTRRKEEKKARIAAQLMDRHPTSALSSISAVRAAEQLVQSFSDNAPAFRPDAGENAARHDDTEWEREIEMAAEDWGEKSPSGSLSSHTPAVRHQPNQSPQAAAINAGPGAGVVGGTAKSPQDVMVVVSGARNYRYAERAARIVPRYTPFDFANAVKNANYKIV